VQECAESGEQKRIRVNQSTTLVLITTIYIVHVQLIDPNYGVAHGGAVAQGAGEAVVRDTVTSRGTGCGRRCGAKTRSRANAIALKQGR
jgi:hypothetical protein